MKMVNGLAAIFIACLCLVSPARAQPATTAANAIENFQIAQQGKDIALRIDLREPLAVPPTGFSVATPAKIALDFQETVNASGKNTQVLNQGICAV